LAQKIGKRKKKGMKKRRRARRERVRESKVKGREKEESELRDWRQRKEEATGALGREWAVRVARETKCVVGGGGGKEH
jgi:hypothetical protein